MTAEQVSEKCLTVFRKKPATNQESSSKRTKRGRSHASLLSDPGYKPTPAARHVWERANPGTSPGFSLLEVLAALVVTMLLVLALTPFTGQMLSTWARGSEAAGLVEVMARGVGVLRNDLRHAIVWTGQGRKENFSLFRGNEVSLSFLAAAGRNGLRMISITVDADGDGRALVRRSAPLIGATPGTFTDPVVLLSGPFSYRFRYTSRKGQELPGWTNPHELPARVELSIVGRSGPVFKAPLELPVLASLSAACLVNKKLPGCPRSQPDEQDINKWMKDFGYTGDE
jgi:type II secretory pathway component PulJ